MGIPLWSMLPKCMELVRDNLQPILMGNSSQTNWKRVLLMLADLNYSRSPSERRCEPCCTHRPSLLPIEWLSEAFGLAQGGRQRPPRAGKLFKLGHLEEVKVVTRFLLYSQVSFTKPWILVASLEFRLEPSRLDMMPQLYKLETFYYKRQHCPCARISLGITSSSTNLESTDQTTVVQRPYKGRWPLRQKQVYIPGDCQRAVNFRYSQCPVVSYKLHR
jgi:hypothetical protein